MVRLILNMTESRFCSKGLKTFKKWLERIIFTSSIELCIPFNVILEMLYNVSMKVNIDCNALIRQTKIFTKLFGGLQFYQL